MALATVGVWATTRQAPSPPAFASILIPNGTTLSVEIADTPARRAAGLAGRDSLPMGLLLVWPRSGHHPIWMHDMRQALDLIWCNDKGRVLTIEHEAPPCPARGPCPLYGTSLANTRMVLELPAGEVRRHHLKADDRLVITRVGQ